MQKPWYFSEGYILSLLRDEHLKSISKMKEVFIKMALDAWQTYQKRTEDLFNELPDAKLANEVSPGRNSGIYLLGHLTAVHDSMLPLLGSGEPLYPALRKPFIEQ